MTKILALIAGIFLIGFPAWMLKEMSVPLPEYRKGGYVDYVLLAYELLAVYGSVLLGIAVHVGRRHGAGSLCFRSACLRRACGAYWLLLAHISSLVVLMA